LSDRLDDGEHIFSANFSYREVYELVGDPLAASRTKIEQAYRVSHSSLRLLCEQYGGGIVPLTDIRIAKLGNDAGIIGAASLGR
jgi:hypothetical protein